MLVLGVKSRGALEEESKTPLLLEFLFGEAAGTAHHAASPPAAGLVRSLRGLGRRARADPRAENDQQMEARLAAGGVTMICTGDSSTPKGSQNDKQG